MQDDPIAYVLDDLLKLDDILACMVARRNMISVMPSGEGFKSDVLSIWDIIKRAMDDVFGVIREYSQAGLAEMEFRLQDYEVLFYVFPDTENALVAIIPALANVIPARLFLSRSGDKQSVKTYTSLDNPVITGCL